MNTIPLVIEETNISLAWCKVLQHILNNPGNEITPLMLSLTSFDETDEIRRRLDFSLKTSNETSIQTVANTIFPSQLYQLCKYDRHALYDSYMRNLPRLKGIESNNARGTYFERLIAFDDTTNQLEIIISSFLDNPSVRRSKLQAGIFDAKRDHINGPYQGFPCLQHLTFYVTENNGLVLNSFYAIQLLYRKAYGNWLGLTNLGKFMAKELNLNFERFNCFVGVEQLEITKEKAKKLLEVAN